MCLNLYKSFSGAVIQSLHSDVDLLLCDVGEIPMFREVLSYQSISVLVSATFPRSIGVSEKEVGSEFLADGFMACEFSAIV